MSLFRLAERLSRTVTELGEMPVSELFEWFALAEIDATDSGSSNGFTGEGGDDAG